jgi:HAD superfamily hydrolase (TIGR01662 family)
MSSPGVFKQYELFIFDADDTLRRTIASGKPCPHGPDEWVLMPGVEQVLRQVQWGTVGGPQLGIASNQDQVAYGHLTLDMARRLLRDLSRSAANFEPPDAALQLCPHALDIDCECRKPKPRMLQAIMHYYGITPAHTLFVGNHEVDRETAARAATAFSWSKDFFCQEE